MVRCKICLKKFYDLPKLKIHHKSQNCKKLDPILNVMLQVLKSTQDSKSNECQKCGLNFRIAKSLNKHKRKCRLTTN